MIPAASYDPDTLDGDSLRTSMAKRILAAAKEGERDPARLKRVALSEIDA
jgi:hypothetical protein